jgi:hypothetical protein
MKDFESSRYCHGDILRKSSGSRCLAEQYLPEGRYTGLLEFQRAVLTRNSNMADLSCQTGLEIPVDIRHDKGTLVPFSQQDLTILRKGTG